jgi:hypothetical protein
MAANKLPHSVQRKLDLMFEGVRYSEALGIAAERAFPNYYPYRFLPDEPNPTGRPKVTIPYLMTLADGTLVRIKGDGAAPWVVRGTPETGFRLEHDDGTAQDPIDFEPLPAWMKGTTSDGFPMARAGVSLHGDMMVVNIAPGCEYFVADKQAGVSMRCTFCAYGAPDGRKGDLGQEMGRTELPERTYHRMLETMIRALAETKIRHIYLVGGSMTDWHREGERFIELARRVQSELRHRIPLTCGSGALPRESLQTLFQERLVENVCFNLEVWSESLFAKICPGKQRFVGYDRWLGSLQQAVGLWGRGNVYSAMVAGIELEPEHGLTWEAAADLALQGAEDLCNRGIIPIYSQYWPIGGRDHPDYMLRLRSYFERLALGYRDVRRRHGLKISGEFMCHRCAYMQLECDLDRG